MRIKTLFILLVLFLSCNVHSQSWSPLGSGMNYNVEEVTVYNNELIAGGWFTNAGGNTAYYIAKWNGNNWSCLDSGMNARVLTLTVYNNELIAGGQFTTAGGISANCIAKWNGTSWSPLGSGFSGGSFGPQVNALTVYNNELIAGGQFANAGGVSANNIAKWNGTSWSPLGSGVVGVFPPPPGVLALTVFNNELIAGGLFTTAGGNPANNIARWNGTTWAPIGSGVGTGINDRVYSLTTFNSELIIGGYFTSAGGISANRIAKWNGSVWSTLGSGMNWIVFSLIEYNNELIAGGEFTIAGGNSANYIARWNGYVWSSLGSGVGGGTYGPDIWGLTIYNNELVAGGRFLFAGGTSAPYIAKWGLNTGIKNNNGEIPQSFSLSQNYPNPFNPVTKINFEMPVKGHVSLKIFDIRGREVKTLINEVRTAGNYIVDFDGSGLSSGMYFYELIADGFNETRKMVLLK